MISSTEGEVEPGPAGPPDDPGPLAKLTRLGLPAVLAVAVVARVGYWVLVTPRYVPASDASQYDEIARNLAAGRGFAMQFPSVVVHPTAFRPPLYPLLLGLVYRIVGPSITAGRLLSLVLGVGVVALTVLVGEQVANRPAGLLAGLAVALYPPLLANDTALLSEPLALLLLLALTLAAARRRPVLAGLLCGLLVLTRPSAQGLAVVAGAWCVWRWGWRRAAVFVAMTALVVAPWLVRNQLQLGSPVLVTSNGFNLAAVYSPQARARGGFVDPAYDRSFDFMRITQLDEVVWQRDLQHLALQSLRQHPGQVPRVVATNVAAFFELQPWRNHPAEAEDGRNLTFVAWTLPLFYVVTGVGLVGLALRWRDPVLQLLVAVVATFVLASVVLVAPPRLRAPFDLLCCIGVGIAVDAALRRRAAARSPQVSA